MKYGADEQHAREWQKMKEEYQVRKDKKPGDE
jgi:hypothetical protein